MNHFNSTRTACLVCGNTRLTEIIHLGLHSFADRFIPKENLKEIDPAYPLVCDLCAECGGIQSRYVTDPHDRYCTVDYSYTSSNSSFSRDHWTAYAQEVAEVTSLVDQLVVEVGSNDGFLSEQFAQRGARVIGVDPSAYMVQLAQKRGVETIEALFSSALVPSLQEKYGRAHLVVANNVFNHSEDPVDFARAAASLLTDKGYFVFELPYWAIGVRTGKFDQIYHEHVIYLTARSSSSILERAGLSISRIEVVNYHGGSLRVYAQKNTTTDHCPEARALITQETKEGLFDSSYYEQFMKKLLVARSRFLKRVHDIKLAGAPIIAVGAPAKGNTFLNFYKLDNTLIDYVTDSSPHKKGKYTPLSRIPIVGDEIFATYQQPYALLLSWNIAEQLKKTLGPINQNITFISPEEPM